MVKRGRKGEEEEDEMELDDDYQASEDDDEIDFELDLPDVLTDINKKEKRELLDFKRSHNEKEWEEEMLRRQDAVARRIDMERLQRLAKAGGEGTAEASKRGAKGKTAAPKGRASAAATAASRRGKRRVDESDEEEEEEYAEEDEDEAPAKKRRSSRIGTGAAGTRKKAVAAAAAEEEEEDKDDDDDGDDGDFAGGDDDSDDDDDLFDSDEEEAISSNKYKKGAAASTSATAADDDDEAPAPATSKGGRLQSKRAAAARARDEDDDEDARFAAKSAAVKSGKKQVAVAADEDNGSDGDDDWLEREEEKGSGNNRDRRGSKGGAGAAKDGDDDQEEGEEQDAEDSPEAQLVDYIKIQLRRTVIKKWLSEPFFEHAVKGLFVRVFTGMANVKGPVVDGPDGPTDTREVPIYRMAEVVGVEHGGRAYKIDQGDSISTTIRLTLAVGHNPKPHIKMSDISSRRLQPMELDTYLQSIRGSRALKPLSQKQVANRREAAKKASNHQYTHKEINDMIDKKHGLKHRAVTTNESNAMNKLERDRKQAQETKNFEKMEEVQKAIESLKRDIERNKELAHIMSVKQVSVNKRNKMANFKKDLDAGVRKRLQDEALSKGLAVTALMDPFIRRETRPRILWNTGVQDPDKAGDDGEKAKKAALAAAVEAAKKEEKEKLDKQRDDDFYRLNRLSLDEVRMRVKERLGVDPIEIAKEDRRDRYLRRVCADLPPVGSQAREKLRKGISLTEWMEQMTREK